jgi:hypothetical protein
MLEDNFNVYNAIPESTSGMITFEEYLQRKGESIEESSSTVEIVEDQVKVEDRISETVSSGMITFEEYLQQKESYSSNEEVKLTFDDLIFVDEDTVPEASGMMTFIEYLESKNLIVKEEDLVDIQTSNEIINTDSTNIGYTKKTLWDGYVQHVKFHAKKAPIINIQDPKYLDESRANYAKFLIEEQQKTWDKIYFFTPGGRPVEEEEDECAVIGRAVIGKNKIC